MDYGLMCQELPTKGPEDVRRWACRKHLDDLGGERTIFRRVSKIDPIELKPLMRPEDWTDEGRHWVAECQCTICDATWHTQWIRDGSIKGIAVVEGEDGLTYPQLGEYDYADGTYIQLGDGDGFLCPFCAGVTTLTHASKLRGGRTWRLLVTSVENVGIYTTVFYWLVSRYIDESGCVFSDISPWNAYVLDEAGRLRRFIWKDGDGWRFSKKNGDALFSKYPSMDGGCYNYRMGGWSIDQAPDMSGCTGEKTGLLRYVLADGQMPVLYLKTWARHRTLENLVNAGWIQLVEQILHEEGERQDIPYAIAPQINFGSARPHEMVRMDRVSFREINRKHPGGWGMTQHDAWIRYVNAGGQADAVMFDDYYRAFHLAGVNTVLELRGICPGIDFPRIDRYLQKQGLRHTDVSLLADTWRMTMRIFGRAQLTSEEMWPRDLFGTHERLSRQRRLENSKDDWSKYLEGFVNVRKRLKALEWTDGELCVVIPKDNGDLIREGDVLRHCVHGYGEDHVSGRHTIFFIRKYRRPERSYYTLDINMLGRPKRQQLHGYGNERHGPHKEYSHSIPQKVKDFCDRWEREVLMPWYREQQRLEAQRKADGRNMEARTA